MAAGGRVDEGLLERLNALPYYGMGYPKSLGNEFGTDTVYPMVREALGVPGSDGMRMETADGLRTYVEHIAVQVGRAVEGGMAGEDGLRRMLVTGGGAHNGFLVERLRAVLAPLGIEVIVPDGDDRALIDYKEALVMALIGVLRWREENNVLASVTGASRDSIGGAVWIA
jgi:anhydro-N-acetylmuramic acid kinase